MVVAPPLSLSFCCRFLVRVAWDGRGRDRSSSMDGRTHLRRSDPHQSTTRATSSIPACLRPKRRAKHPRASMGCVRATAIGTTDGDPPSPNQILLLLHFLFWGEETRTFAVDHVRRVALVRERCGPPHVANAAATARKRKGEERERDYEAGDRASLTCTCRCWSEGKDGRSLDVGCTSWRTDLRRGTACTCSIVMGRACTIAIGRKTGPNKVRRVRWTTRR